MYTTMYSGDVEMTVTITARPYDFAFNPAQSAFVIIDMQRDFVEPGGFGAALGNDVSKLRVAIEPIGGEGMGLALRSAELATTALIESRTKSVESNPIL